MADLESLNLKIKAESSSATSQLDKLSKSLDGLKVACNSLGVGGKVATAALSGIKGAASLSGKALKGVGTAVKNAMPSFKGLNASVGDLKLGFIALIAVMRKVVQALASCVKQSMDFVETMNLFNVSMGDNAIAAGEFAEKVQQAMGIDMAEWMRNQGVFQTLIEGFGVASEKADIMSQQLTQLGYDLSSLFNMPFAESMQKLQSGIAGELEPLRRLGFDLSQAKLQQIAFDHGIQQTVQTMTQAQKSQLRYYAIMTQVTTAHGDMARTIMQPANMLRVFRQNVTIAARSVGNLLIPVMQKLAAVGIIVARGIARVANGIAALFGIDTNGWRDFMDDMNYGGDTFDDIESGIDDVGSASGRASKKVKEFKKQFLGFDKINNITLPDPYNSSGGGGGGSVGGGGDWDLPLPTYDFLQGITDAFAEVHPTLQKLFDDLAEDMENGGKNIGTILGTALKDGLDSIKWQNIQINGKVIAANIASTINDFLEVPGLFNSIGTTVGNALNTIFMMANTWANVFHWDSLGSAVSEGINGFFKTFKLSLVAETFSNVAVGILSALSSAVGGTDFGGIAENIASGLEAIKWNDIKEGANTLAENVASGINDLLSKKSLFKDVGSSIAEALNTIFSTAKTWSEKFSWSKLGEAISSSINGFFEKFDFKMAAEAIWNIASGLMETVKSAVSKIDWGAIGSAIGSFLANLDWLGLVTDAIELAGLVVEGVADFAINFVKSFALDLLEWLYKVITGRNKAVMDINLNGSEDPSYTKVKSEYDSTTDKPVDITIGGKKGSTWATTTKDFNSIKDKPAEVTLGAKAPEKEKFSYWKDKYDKLKGKNVKATLKATRSEKYKEYTKDYKNLPTSKGITLNATATISKGVSDLKDLLDRKTSKKFNFTATGDTMTLTPMTMATGGIFKNGKWRSITAAANGGAFNTGQMFIAREAGPELVGRIGSSTAVMNNNQIVSSVAAGVASANASQTSLLRQLVSAVQSGGEVALYVDGVRFGQVAINSINTVQRQAGRTLIKV